MNDRLTAYIRTALLSRRAAEISLGDRQVLIAHLQAVLAFYCPAFHRTYMTAIYKADGVTQGLQDHFNVLRELGTHPDPDARNTLYVFLCGALIRCIKDDFDQEGRSVTHMSVIEDVISGPRLVWKNFKVVAALAKARGGRLQDSG
ncbi:hypothetical protein EV715DRAFT_204445 [Schizophyllum commune]